jgi:hypothetical protein
LLRGNEPLGSISGGALAADSRATRSAIRFSRFRKLESRNCASSVGSDALHNRPRMIRVMRVVEDWRGN